MIGVLAAIAGAGAVRPPGPGRPLAALHRRRRLRRRLQPGGHRRAARLARQQLPRLVERDGAGDHGQPRPPGARRGADQQLLPHRPGDRQALRARDVPLRQSRRSCRVCGPARSILQCSRGRDRARGGRRVRAPATSEAASWFTGGHRALPESERAGGDHRRHASVSVRCRRQ